MGTQPVQSYAFMPQGRAAMPAQVQAVYIPNGQYKCFKLFSATLLASSTSRAVACRTAYRQECSREQRQACQRCQAGQAAGAPVASYPFLNLRYAPVIIVAFCAVDDAQLPKPGKLPQVGGQAAGQQGREHGGIFCWRIGPSRRQLLTQQCSTHPRLLGKQTSCHPCAARPAHLMVPDTVSAASRSASGAKGGRYTQQSQLSKSGSGTGSSAVPGQPEWMVSFRLLGWAAGQPNPALPPQPARLCTCRPSGCEQQRTAVLSRASSRDLCLLAEPSSNQAGGQAGRQAGRQQETKHAKCSSAKHGHRSMQPAKGLGQIIICSRT